MSVSVCVHKCFYGLNLFRASHMLNKTQRRMLFSTSYACSTKNIDQRNDLGVTVHLQREIQHLIRTECFLKWNYIELHEHLQTLGTWSILNRFLPL